jgi:predicted RNA binding protein YcfA (HicA-like mRNA interferase family)
MLRAFARLGWTVARHTGSHAIVTKPGRTPVTIPVHPGTLKLGTAKAILKQAGLTEDDFFEAY